MAVLLGVGGAVVRDAVAQEPTPARESAPELPEALAQANADELARELGQDPRGEQPAGSTDGGQEPAVDLSPPGMAVDPADTAMTSEERVSRGKQFVSAVERASQSILRQLQTARTDRDVVRVLCLNDKLNQVDVASRSAQDRLGALRTAAEQGDPDRTRHEYTVLEVLHDRVRVLVNESNQCVGEETGFIGDAEVSVSIDPNLPDADTGFGPDWSSLPPLPNISSPIE